MTEVAVWFVCLYLTCSKCLTLPITKAWHMSGA
jgi:hypothetical protein